MKGKSFRIKLFFTMILTILACLPIMFSSSKVVYAAETDSVDSFALYYEGNVTNSDSTVGETSGYGTFVLDDKDKMLTATPHAGYEVVGWQVTYLETDLAEGVERPENQIILEGEASILKTKAGNDVEIEINYLDNDGDYHCDKSTFILKQVFEDIKVIPLFDYIYYKLNVNSMAELDLPDFSFNIDEDVVYTSTENPETATELDDVVIKIGENYYYYGKLYLKGEKYCTLHESQEIDYSRGAFRLGENVEFAQTINFYKEDLKNSTNIDVQGFELNGIALKESDGDEIENFFTLTKEKNYGLTTGYSLKVTIENANDNILKVNYHELQMAKLNIFIDDILQESGDALTQISSIVSVENYFAQIDDDEYFVKKSQDTSFTFYLVCAENYTTEIDSEIYYYFNFASLDGSDKNQKHFYSINEDFEIAVKYNSVEYYVNFEFVDVSDGGFEVENSLTEINPIALKRGQNFNSETHEGFDIPNSTGYLFKGFADETQNIVDSVSCTLDSIKPKNKTVYLCYEKIEYVLKLMNINQKALADSEGNDVYAINELLLLKDGEINETILGSEIISPKILTEYEFNTKIKINESVSLDTIVNTGFEALKFTFALRDNYEDIIFVEDSSFSFNKEFIDAASIIYDDEGEYYYLPIYAVEEYVYYTLTYYTEPTHDHLIDQNVIMANLDVLPNDNENYEYKYLTASEEETVENAQDLAKIEISKIKHYEIITLQSSGKQDSGLNNYVFIMFTEDDKSSLAVTKNEEIYSFITSPINRSFSIKVVYTVPVASVEVVSNIADAYSEIIITQNAQEVVLDEELQVLKLTVGLDLTIAAEINFGYKVIGYELTVNGKTTSLPSTNTTYTLETVEYALPHVVEILFEKIEYNFHFTQVGGGVDNEKILFDDGKVDYLALNVENRTISFNKPDGYYVNITKFVVSVGEESTEIEYSAMNENNDKRNDVNNWVYFHELELEEFINVVTNYQTKNGEIIEVHVKVKYEIYKFNVSVQYSLADYDERVIFPEITLEYGTDNTSIESKYDLTAKTLLFEGVPHNSIITLKVSNDIQTGLSHNGWKNSEGNDLDSALFNEISTYLLSTKTGILNDKEFVYKLSYIIYSLQLIYNGAQGSPEVYLNNAEEKSDLNTLQIKLFDLFTIYANPSKANGYIFDNFYKSSDYSDENLLDGTKISGEYYEETDFRVENYSISGTTLTIYIKYKEMEISILNETLNYDKKIHLNGVGSSDKNARINILLKDYASYTVEAKPSDDGVWRPVNLTGGDKVTAKDIVRITIQVNKNATNQFDGQNYDLTKGIILYNDIKLAGQSGYRWTGGYDGKYILKFEVSTIISNINSENPLIKVEYRYQIQTVNVLTTSNIISDESFYSGVTLTINEKDYGFSRNTQTSAGKSSVKSTLQFLAMSHSSYELSDEYKEYFRISNVKIFDADGIEISSSTFANRGIRVNYKDAGNKEIENVVVRYLENVKIVFQLTPIVLYDGEEKISDYEFSSYYHCDVNGNGKVQALTVGTYKSANISSASQEIVDSMIITYKDSNGNPVDAPMACGRYTININFKTDTYKWMSDIKLPYSLTWKINPRPIIVTNTDNFAKATKVYDGYSSYTPSEVFGLLKIVDGLNGVLNVAYSESNANGGFSFINDKMNSASITTTLNSEEVEIKKANENVYYNVQIKNLRLNTNNSFNNSFILINDSVVIPEYIQITRRQVYLENLDVANKVEDGKKVANYNKESVKISDKSKINGDELYLDSGKMIVEFEDAKVGNNKNVLIDATKALTGADSGNYFIEETVMTNKTIYPYKVCYELKDVGKICLINKLGLNDFNYAALIPVGAELKVETIAYDSAEYTEIYRFIAKHFTRGNEFSIGYKLSLWLNGKEIAVDKNLFLSVPYTDKLTGVAYLTGEQSNKIDYQLEDGQIIINLNQINEDIDSIILLKSKSFMKWWQILIIVLSILLILIAIIIVIVITRRRTKEKYSINEKI